MRLPRGRRFLAVATLALAACATRSPAAPRGRDCRLERWAVCYEQLKAACREGRPDEALGIVDSLLAARHRKETNHKLISGSTYGEYYVFYYQARAFFQKGRYEEASSTVERSKHPDTALLKKEIDPRYTPPVFESPTAEILETSFASKGRTSEEIVKVEVRGTVTCRGGVSSIRAENDDVPYTGTDKGYVFSKRLQVDAGRKSLSLVAQDVSGFSSSTSVALSLPPLGLGAAAESIHAVLVGVDRYETKAWLRDDQCLPQLADRCGGTGQLRCYPISDLGAAANDADNFANLLRRRGVPERNLRVLTSRSGDVRATRKAVLDALAEIREQRGGTAIFFFAGHGLHSAKEQNLMLLSDSQGWECAGPDASKNDLAATSISVTEIVDALKQGGFDARFVILDACRSKRRSDKGRGSETRAKGLTPFRGLELVPESKVAGEDPIVLFAAQEGRSSIEWKVKESGYFTWFLLQALRQDLNLLDLSMYVQKHVREQTANDFCGGKKDDSCLDLQVPVVAMSEIDFKRQRETFILRASAP